MTSLAAVLAGVLWSLVPFGARVVQERSKLVQQLPDLDHYRARSIPFRAAMVQS